MKPDILITGATGFVGKYLCSRLIKDGTLVTGTILPGRSPQALCHGVYPVTISPLSSATSWTEALHGIRTLFHLAARAHITHETVTDPLKEFRVANTEGTRHLALQAARAGVKRFVFMSTIGVNGCKTPPNLPFTDASEIHPHNPYSISKYEAEQSLWQISRETGLEVVVIRSPLVYGPGNPGNFFSLLRLVSKGIPLPLASIENKRSLVYVGNLVDALVACATHPEAAGKTYLVSDGEEVSTPELIRRVASSLGKKARLFSFPVALVRLLGAATGRGASLGQLTGSLTVDNFRIRSELNWKPPFSMEQGLRDTAEWFKANGEQ